MLSAHQPSYLPWLGYFHKILKSEKYVIMDAVQYEKNSFINRNKIKTANGSCWLTIPVMTKGYKEKTIKDMKIDNSVNWSKKHWKTIKNSYTKAPHFLEYEAFFEDAYSREWKYLIDIIEHQNRFFLESLQANKEIHKLSTLKLDSKKQHLIVDMCRVLHSKAFLFGSNGTAYVDDSFFEKENIDVSFQQYQHPTYPQLWGEFVPNLSILDLFFNVSLPLCRDIILGSTGKNIV